MSGITMAFEISLNNRGLEFGFNGKRHFKLLNTYEGYYAKAYDKIVISGYKISLQLQWLRLQNEWFKFNLLSGMYIERDGYHATYH